MVWFGNTDRLPFASTAPIPGAIETSVASVVFHDKVEDWPRSIERGSAVSRAVGALGGGGAGCSTFGGGGGGGGAGPFFLQLAANIANVTAKTMKLIFFVVELR